MPYVIWAPAKPWHKKESREITLPRSVWLKELMKASVWQVLAVFSESICARQFVCFFSSIKYSFLTLQWVSKIGFDYIRWERGRRAKNKAGTRKYYPGVWPSAYACSQCYHPGYVRTTVSAILGLTSMALPILGKAGFCKRDMVVHMRTVIATPWGWCSVCSPCLSSLFRKLPDSAFSGIRDPRDWVPDITRKSCPDSRIGITFCVASLPWIHVGRSLTS